MQFTLLQLVAAVLVAIALLLVFQVWRRRNPNAPILAETRAVEKRVEDYTEAEIAKLAAGLIGRLTDTTVESQMHAEANASAQRKALLLGKIQAIVANAKMPD